MAERAPALNTLTDQEVVLLARAGQERAYRELVRRYERPIFSLLYRMVRDRELAEDLSQETFVKALNAIESYRPEYKFSSWLFKIANNAAIDHLRRRELDTLLTCPIGMPLRVTRIADQDPAFLRFIENNDLKPGQPLEVEIRDQAADSVVVRSRERRVTIGARAASKLLVEHDAT